MILSEDTQIDGGKLTGTIQGQPNNRGLIKKAKILANSKLSHVTIDKGTDCAKSVKIGAGVRFVNKDLIPEGSDLTAALSTHDGIDMNTDLVINAPSLLSQINALPKMQANNWQLVTNPETGQLEVMLENTRLVVVPLQIKQTKRRPQLILHDEGRVTIVTAKGREILVDLVSP
ncbi:hypothetical protein BGS_1071 [Beggiatoa sp. SS]|nr:hypothetical protein BGS_1071 [Beggiatoa sp. SS]